LVGVKTAKKLKVDFVDVEFGNAAEGGESSEYYVAFSSTFYLELVV
jgi:hypothetical protein